MAVISQKKQPLRIEHPITARPAARRRWRRCPASRHSAAIPTALLADRRLRRAEWLLMAPPTVRHAPSRLPQKIGSAWPPGPHRTGEHLPPRRAKGVLAHDGQVLCTRRGRRSPLSCRAPPVQWHLGRCDRGRSGGSSFPAQPDGRFRSPPDDQSGPFKRPSFRQKSPVWHPRPSLSCESGVRAVGISRRL